MSVTWVDEPYVGLCGSSVSTTHKTSKQKSQTLSPWSQLVTSSISSSSFLSHISHFWPSESFYLQPFSMASMTSRFVAKNCTNLHASEASFRPTGSSILVGVAQAHLGMFDFCLFPFLAFWGSFCLLITSWVLVLVFVCLFVSFFPSFFASLLRLLSVYF